MLDRPPHRRQRLLLAAALASLALAADTVVWTLTCRRLDDGAHDAARQSGLELNTTPARWSGWPLAAQISYADTTLRNGPATARWLWTVSTLILRHSAFDPFHLVVTAAGRQTLTLGNGPTIPFTAATAAATIDLTQRTPPRLVIDSLTLDTPAPLRLANAALTITPDGWSADLSGLSLPGPDGRPIHPTIDTLRLDGQLTPPLEARPTLLDTARRWQAQNGHLDLVLRALRWGALDASARATTTLDPALQPQADGTLTATGLSATLTQLADTGLITPRAAAAASAILTILTTPTGSAPLTLPTSWHDGIVTIARFPLLRTTPIDWP